MKGIREKVELICKDIDNMKTAVNSVLSEVCSKMDESEDDLIIQYLDSICSLLEYANDDFDCALADLESITL